MSSVPNQVPAEIVAEATRLTDAAFDQFTALYPDWQQHTGRMLELSQKIQPKEELSGVEYLELLLACAVGYHVLNASNPKGVC